MGKMKLVVIIMPLSSRVWSKENQSDKDWSELNFQNDGTQVTVDAEGLDFNSEVDEEDAAEVESYDNNSSIAWVKTVKLMALIVVMLVPKYLSRVCQAYRICEKAHNREG